MESKFHKGKFLQFIEIMGEKKTQKIRWDLRMGYRRKEYGAGLPYKEKYWEDFRNTNADGVSKLNNSLRSRVLLFQSCS